MQPLSKQETFASSNCRVDQNSKSSKMDNSFPATEESKIPSFKKRPIVRILVWNRRQSFWGKYSKEGKTFFRNRTFYLIKSPAYHPNIVKDRNQEIREQDSISASSKCIKKKKPVEQFLKHKDYKKFLQTYIHIQNLSKICEMKEIGDANLMWLLDFKVDTIFNPEEETYAGRRRPPKGFEEDFSREHKIMKMAATEVDYLPTSLLPPLPSTPEINMDSSLPFDPSNPEHAFTVDLDTGLDDVANFEQVEECQILTAEMAQIPTDDGTGTYSYRNVEVTYDEHGKPRCTYTDLIERALTESGGLTVSEIYQWISDHYPFFRPDDDRWKNSVRHNLSINPYFKKGEKARSGAGHLWTISEESRALKPALKRKECEAQEVLMSIENDTDRAVANILGQYHLAKNTMEGSHNNNHNNQKKVSDQDCNTPPSTAIPLSGNDESSIALIDDSTSQMIIEYDNSFQNQEYTIDLSSFQFPDVNFDDIMPGGLIVIQSDHDPLELDDNKENAHIHLDPSNDYNNMISEYTPLREESQMTDTERVSGQLISEALTQEFDMHKEDKVEDSSREFVDHPNQLNMAPQDKHFENMHETSETEQQNYMSLDSMDHITLQEAIIQSNNGIEDTSSDQYTTMLNMTSSIFEHKDIEYCNFEGEVPHCQ